MTLPALTLTDFLLARIAEDERVALVADIGVGHGVRPDELWTITNPPRGEVCAMPARVLAECDAKRRIVERYQVAAMRLERGQGDRAVEGIRANESRSVLKLLALPYADHPDYRRDEWRP